MMETGHESAKGGVDLTSPRIPCWFLAVARSEKTCRAAQQSFPYEEKRAESFLRASCGSFQGCILRPERGREDNLPVRDEPCMRFPLALRLHGIFTAKDGEEGPCDAQVG